MLQSLKNLIVVLVIAVVVFRLVKPIMLSYCSDEDFLRRRTIWFVLTIAAFLTPSPWVYGAIAVPLLLFAGRKDTNPTALYLLLLHVTPEVAIDVPVIGSLSTQLMLAIAILLPAGFRLLKSKTEPRIRGLTGMDCLLLAYLLLSSALYIHQLTPDGTFYPSTPYDFVRRLVFKVLETFLPYFVISRSNCSRRAIVDAVSAFWLSCVLMAAIGIFESLRGWLLYEVIPWNWGAPGGVFLMRGESLRAAASSGHPLALGYLLAIAFGCWLYLQEAIGSKFTRAAIFILLWLGEFAAYSRGPWICAVLIYFLFAAQRPGAVSAITKSLFVASLAAVAISFSPLAKKITSVIPFFGGHVDTGNIDYRERLWSRGWDVIWQSPFLGDQYAMTKMQDLRQGEGIIDFINMYIAELIATGFVGLSLFLSVVLIAIGAAWASSKRIRRVNVEFSLLGGALVSCILGTLFLWAFGGPDLSVVWALVALAAAYGFIGEQRNLGLITVANQGLTGSKL
jgi:hypothetical protein